MKDIDLQIYNFIIYFQIVKKRWQLTLIYIYIHREILKDLKNFQKNNQNYYNIN